MVGFGQDPKFGDAQHDEERNHRQERDQQLGFDTRGNPCDEPDDLAAQPRDDTGGRAEHLSGRTADRPAKRAPAVRLDSGLRGGDDNR